MLDSFRDHQQQDLFDNGFRAGSGKRNIRIRVDDLDSLNKIKAAFLVGPSADGPPIAAKDLGHYIDMPRFVQKQSKPLGFFDIKTDMTSESLSQLLDQPITDKTKSVWYPQKDRTLGNVGWIDTSGLKPKYPIYILSKGRSKCITAKVLEKSGVDFTIVVEPQEEAEYRALWGDRVHAGDFVNASQSSIPVRNYIHELCTADKYWLMDDNIEAFYAMTDNTKFESRTPVIFRATEDFVERFSNVGQAGLNYHTFCKKTDSVPPYYLNTRIYSCTLMHKHLSGVAVDGKMWRGRWNEDTDLSLRILKAGYCTVLMNSFLAGKVTSQRMAGGNTDTVYSNSDDRMGFADSLAAQHPDVAERVWKFGRWQHKVSYQGFTQRLNYIGHEVVDYGLKLDENARGRDLS